MLMQALSRRAPLSVFQWVREVPAGPVLAALVLFGGVCICVARAAEPLPAGKQVIFDIPSQSLSEALHAYGRKVGTQVLYESRSAMGKVSASVEGSFTSDEALKRLLANTGLEFRRASAYAVTIVAPAAEEADLPPANPLATADFSIGEVRVKGASRPNNLERFTEYSELVRADIQRALLRNPRTGSGNYRAVIDIWIDPSRSIKKATLLNSTGEAERDTAITKTLEALAVSRPPPGDAPQPLRAVVTMSTAR
jgi:TonB C terminal